ncbi:MAG: hypothetical protein GY855_03940 [candidate division Zixibacteria bacterium]|nr:hypothetical protein [candidate division Zixibacteria bacterium]
MRRIWILIIVNIFLISNADSQSPVLNPALEIISKYQTLHPDTNSVNPFLVNLMSIDLLKKDSDTRAVKNYIDWYLSRLNYPDRHGLTGTIYDYKVYSPNKIKSTDTYKSVDRYAATFILLIHQYYQSTKDGKFIGRNRARLEDIIYLISHMQDTDGLTTALPETHEKLLINNCESFAALSAFTNLSKTLEWDLESFYETIAEGSKDALLTHFYNDTDKMFYVSINGNYRQTPVWESFDPDAYSQLFPILYNILPEKEGIRESLWNQIRSSIHGKSKELTVEQTIVYNWVLNEPYIKNPAIEIMREYQELEPYSNIVIPYIVNLMAMDLLKNKSRVDDVKKYILWYLSHLNYSDKYNITGSICDYKVLSHGLEKSLESWDSVDSYAATFIILIYEYYKLTDDRKLIEENRQQLEDIIYLIPYLQDEDDLTIALPGVNEKYLMDNCESYGGVCAFIELSKDFKWGLESYYETVKEGLKYAILTHFYDESEKVFNWFIDGKTKYQSNWNNFYPDAYAQLFPILYDVLPDEKGVKESIIEQFHKHHGESLSSIPVEQSIIYKWTMKASK